MTKLTFTTLALLLLVFISCKKTDQIREEKKLSTPRNPFFELNQYFTIYRGSSDPSIYYQYSTNGTTWSGNTKITTSTSHVTETGTTTVFAFDKLFVASKNNSTNTVYLSYTTNGTSWTTIATPLQSNHTPAIIHNVGTGQLHLYGNLSGNLVRSTSTDGISWSSPVTILVSGLPAGQLVGGLTGSYIESLSLIDILFTQANGYIGKISLGTSATYTQLSYQAEYEPDATFLGGFVFKSRTSRAIYYYNPALGLKLIPGAEAYAGPSVTIGPDGIVVVKVRGGGNDIYYCISYNGGNSWTVSRAIGRTNSSPDIAHYSHN